LVERIWQKNYPENTPTEIDLTRYGSINQMFREAVDRFGSQSALSSFGTTLTYEDVDRLSRDFGAFLQTELGVRKGDRVAMMSPNALPFAVGMFGVTRHGN
jgi:long-chain acyl-CoA synthetase